MEEDINESRLKTGITVSECARDYFGNYELVPSNNKLNIMIRETKK
jgi:hypothetical protein